MQISFAKRRTRNSCMSRNLIIILYVIGIFTEIIAKYILIVLYTFNSDIAMFYHNPHLCTNSCIWSFRNFAELEQFLVYDIIIYFTRSCPIRKVFQTKKYSIFYRHHILNIQKFHTPNGW